MSDPLPHSSPMNMPGNVPPPGDPQARSGNAGHRGMPPPPPRHRSASLSCLFSLSLLLNFVAVLVFIILCAGFLARNWDPDSPTIPLNELHYSGKRTATAKIAIIHLDGVIMEGLLSFPHRQIDQAAKDGDVKAVVFRIDSPGGSITASDDIYRRLMELRSGNDVKGTKGKNIIVSMGSMAASGGYYIAMPGKTIVAERTTLTGSIGVYASFPTIADIEEKHGFQLMNTIRQGEIKDSGSPFRKMTPKEQQVWQDMVDTAYDTFLDVVADGRKEYHFNRAKLLEDVEIQPVNAGPARLSKDAKSYQRYRADGGVYTADVALKLNLIDKIGHLDDAIELAKQEAGGGEFKVIEYQKPRSLQELFLGINTRKPGSVLDPGTLRKGLTPRVWYLSPGCECAGALGAMEAD